MENKLELPDWVMETVQKTRGEYDPGEATDYSITSLIQPPMVYELKRANNLPEDLADQLQAFVGTAGHNQIEWALKDNPRYMVEKRLYHTFHIPDAPGNQKDFVVSAQLDLYDRELFELWDHKFSKMYSFISGGKDEHEIQLAFQRYLLKKHGYRVDAVKISGFALDWTKTMVGVKRDYPDSLFCETDYPTWEDEDIELYIKNQIIEKEYAKLGQIRVCNEQERWAKPDKYAVMKKKRKSALKLADSKEEAEEYIETVGGEYIEHRPGDDLRCRLFCNANYLCPFYQEKYGG